MRNLRLRPATFSFEPAPPFRLDLTVWALRRRPDNQVDDWDGEIYRRALALDGKVVEVAAAQTGLPDAPRLSVFAFSLSHISLNQNSLRSIAPPACQIIAHRQRNQYAQPEQPCRRHDPHQAAAVAQVHED